MFSLQEFIAQLCFPRIFAVEWIVLAVALVLFLLLPQRLCWLDPLNNR